MALQDLRIPASVLDNQDIHVHKVGLPGLVLEDRGLCTCEEGDPWQGWGQVHSLQVRAEVLGRPLNCS